MSDLSSRPDETPLESWKVIAAHLKRDIRTVKRWETAEGLPVHRHVHLARSSVYAYASELDAWRATRRPEKELITSASWLGRRKRALALASLTLLALVSSGGGRVMSPVPTAAQERGIFTKQLRVGPQGYGEAALSPDGQHLTYVDWNTGDIAIEPDRLRLGG